MVYKSSSFATGGGIGGGIQSINSDTTSAQIIAAGSGISVGTSAGTTTIAAIGGGSGTVTNVSGVTANGFAFSVANPTTTPAITAKTTAMGVLAGNGTSISGITTGVAGRLLFDQGNANAAFEVASGDISAISTGAFTLVSIQGTPITGATGSGNCPVVLANNPIITNAIFEGISSIYSAGNISCNGNVGINGTFTAGTWNANPITNAYLANSAITIGAQTGLAGGGSVALGSAITLSMGIGTANTLAGYNSSGVFSDISIGSNLSISSTTLTASPGGSNTRIQYNNNTAFGGVINATSDGSNLFVVTQATTDNSTKAASTAYVTTAVNNAIAGVNPAVAVQAATTQASDTSSYTYSNGVSGIGATLTGPNATALTVDGFTFTAVNQRILVKNDTQSPSGAFNGIYYVNALQTGISGVILIRALDYDQPSDINNTGAIPVINGTLNAQTSWVETATVNTVGNDPLSFTKFSLAPSTIITTSTTAGGGLTGTYPNPSLANPSASSLGGVNSISAITHNFLISLSTTGAFAQSQPAFTDLTGTATTAQLPVNQTYREVVFSVDGQGSAIATGGTWYLANTAFAGTITGWSLVVDQSGSIDIDVWKANAAIPTVSNTITASAQCSLASTQSNFTGPITGWTSAISRGDCWGFNIVSASIVTKANLTIQVTAL